MPPNVYTLFKFKDLLAFVKLHFRFTFNKCPGAPFIDQKKVPPGHLSKSKKFSQHRPGKFVVLDARLLVDGVEGHWDGTLWDPWQPALSSTYISISIYIYIYIFFFVYVLTIFVWELP